MANMTNATNATLYDDEVLDETQKHMGPFEGTFYFLIMVVFVCVVVKMATCDLSPAKSTLVFAGPRRVVKLRDFESFYFRRTPVTCSFVKRAALARAGARAGDRGVGATGQLGLLARRGRARILDDAGLRGLDSVVRPPHYGRVLDQPRHRARPRVVLRVHVLRAALRAERERERE